MLLHCSQRDLSCKVVLLVTVQHPLIDSLKPLSGQKPSNHAAFHYLQSCQILHACLVLRHAVKLHVYYLHSAKKYLPPVAPLALCSTSGSIIETTSNSLQGRISNPNAKRRSKSKHFKMAARNSRSFKQTLLHLPADTLGELFP